MIVALGADHAGFALKEGHKQTLDARGVAWRDFGAASAGPVDYPDYAAPVAHESRVAKIRQLELDRTATPRA